MIGRQKKSMKLDRRLGGKILLSIRNIFFYFGVAYGHYVNFNNYKFWEAYVCHTMNRKSHHWAFQFYGMKIFFDLLFCLNNLRDNKPQMFLHIYGSLFLAAAGLIEYEYNPYFHQILSVIACISYPIQMVIHMNQNKVFKNYYTYLALFVYAFAFLYLVFIMIFLKFISYSPTFWNHGALCEWYFTIFSGYIHFLLLYTDEDFEETFVDNHTIEDEEISINSIVGLRHMTRIPMCNMS